MKGQVELKLEGWVVVVDFLAVELGKVDVVLGMQWLDTTGTMKVHWPSLTMVFRVGEKKVKLKGDPSLLKAECSLKTLEKMWESEDQGFLLEWRNYETDNEDEHEEEQCLKGEEEELPMIKPLRVFGDAFWLDECTRYLPISHEPGYGEITAPLTKLLQKNLFKWDKGATLAFENLKLAMTTIPMLALSDWSLPFVVETDASGSGLGAVLSQNGHPIAFFRQKLSPRVQTKSIYKRELMVVVLAVQKWRYYLLGRRFIIMSDQKALKFLLKQREVQPQFKKWLTKLLAYDFEILYQLGLQNKAADALSKVDTTPELNTMTTSRIVDMEAVAKEVEEDEELQKIVKQLQATPQAKPNKWDKFIPWAELWYNTTFHASTWTTPFQAVYCRPPPPLLSYGERKTTNNEVESLSEAKDLAISALKENLQVAQNQMKKMADRKRRELKFKVGDEVQHQEPVLTEEFELQLWPETVLGIRWSKELGENEWLVKWKGLPESEATWESVYLMNQQFPMFHLEDKVNLEPRGIVRPPIICIKEGAKKGTHMTAKREWKSRNGIVGTCKSGPYHKNVLVPINSIFWGLG
ncbi:transposon Tf2-1 polyprotein isoform X1 [Cucumis melo var. makuwa]|uniref:Transposon Tf2-1 polyprotein isoform X1 n=1 Tax=Cucumis melo var. makuwa TaxID=1194695 RepID=A0A5A7UM57_CUCMM|nr:transposon Tf2-1 polyprotein isoform X1 [Cucumis melo var. makuwa]